MLGIFVGSGFVQRGHFIFVEGPAHVVGAATQSDVVFLGAGEIQKRGAEIFFFEEADIDLQAAGQGEADFVFAVGEDLIDARVSEDMFGDGVDDVLAVSGIGFFFSHGDEEIQIANGFFAAAERAGGRDAFHRFAGFFDVIGDFPGGGFDVADEETARTFFESFDGFEDVLFAFFAEAGEVA